jgi:hypothetical protein
MKKNGIFAATAAVILLLGTGCASMPSRSGPKITIRNNTGETIYYVYISPVSSDSWGSDWLGSSETLSNGGSRTFTLAQPLDVENRYDLRISIAYRDTSFVKANQTITNNGVITFTEADRVGGAPQDYRNETDDTILALLGTPYRRNIGTRQIHIYQIAASPGQSIVAWTEGSLDTRIMVLTSKAIQVVRDPNADIASIGSSEILARDDDSGSRLNTRAVVTAPLDGQPIYFIIDVVDNKAGTYVFCTREGAS